MAHVVVTSASSESWWYATQAALLDPRCFHLVAAQSNALDVTVPAGSGWYAINAFAITCNDPVIVAQDAYPNSRRSGFLRPLDARNAVRLPAGTRVRRTDSGASDSYLYYAAPDEVWAIDDRYSDPKALYFDRLERLGAMPLLEAKLEATGGGSIADDLEMALPGDGPILVVAASVYDASWATLGWSDDIAHPLNLFNEINNSHSLRTGEGLLTPLPRGSGLVFALRKGSTSDEPHSTDPAVAYPIKGSANILYHELPSDW